MHAASCSHSFKWSFIQEGFFLFSDWWEVGRPCVVVSEHSYCIGRMPQFSPLLQCSLKPGGTFSVLSCFVCKVSSFGHLVSMVSTSLLHRFCQRGFWKSLVCLLSSVHGTVYCRAILGFGLKFFPVGQCLNCRKHFFVSLWSGKFQSHWIGTWNICNLFWPMHLLDLDTGFYYMDFITWLAVASLNGN